MNLVKQMKQAHLCIGCGVCKAEFGNRLKLGLNSEGKFEIDNLDVWTKDDNLKFKELCPVLSCGPITESMWGDCKAVYYGWSNDANIRYRASSGGIISQTLFYLLAENKVDAVLHVEKSKNDPLKNCAIVCEDEQMIMNGTGSRYAPVVLLENLPKVIDTYNGIAICGKPCDIRAVNNFLKSYPMYAEKVKYTFSFFCGGIPSEKATVKMVDEFGVRLTNLQDITYRGDGWPGFACIKDKEGNSFRMSYTDSWGKILGRDIHRYCKFCVDGIGELADFTCGDGWYNTISGYPSHEEHDGRNIILVRTEKGNNLLKELENKGKITLEKVENYEDTLNSIQPGQLSRRQLLKSRIIPMRLCFQFMPRYPWKCLKRWEQGIELKYRIRVSLGTIKRLIKHSL